MELRAEGYKHHDKTKKLSRNYSSRKEALKRLREIEYFKHANNRE